MLDCSCKCLLKRQSGEKGNQVYEPYEVYEEVIFVGFANYLIDHYFEPQLWICSAHVCKIACKTNFVFNFGSFLFSFIFIFVSWEKIKLGATNTTFARKMLFSNCSLASM